jgi:hypothetical protein
VRAQRGVAERNGYRYAGNLRIKRTTLLFSTVCIAACSFPEFELASPGGSGGASASAPQCKDDLRNGDETGVDCGSDACGKPCSAGQGCKTNVDCDGGACLNRICQAESCDDELKNGAETDVDCGGDYGCPRCTTDETCLELSDCDGGACVSGSCRAPTCNDRLHNGAETDRDCGGPDCASCEEGQSCQSSSDCDNVVCANDKCQPRDCSDGVKNQDETDLDCGGSCPTACADGLRCKDAIDCDSGVCVEGTSRCGAPTCEDGVQNGAEPSLDCGMSCSTKCAVLSRCAVAADCETSSCVSQLCLPSAPTNEVLSMQGWVATASHFGLSSALPPKAIDGSLVTDWISGADQMGDMWFAVDMQSVQVFYSIELLIDNSSNAGDAAESVDVSLSTDGTFPIKAKRNVPGAQKLRIDFEQPQVARHIKLSLSPGVSKTRWWRIDELRVRQ